MPEWWTYSLSDFLMFSPQVYWRLVARHEAAWWPAQGLAVAATLALPALLWVRTQAAGRAALVLLALAWAWLGWAFEWRMYSEIFLGAPWIAAACGVQAVALAGAAAWRGPAQDASAPGAACWVLLAAALLYPLLAPLTGHPWSEAEVFAFLPDPTALAMLGTLAGLRRWPAWLRAALAVIPVLTLLLGAATRWLLA